MKRTLLLAIGVFAFISSQAQQPATGQVVKNAAVPQAKANVANKAVTKLANPAVQNELLLPLRAGNPFTSATAINTNGITIGLTVYDLQTNSAIQNRIKYHGNGKVSAIWTFGIDAPGFPERGMGYNYRTDFTSEWVNNPGYLDINNITRVENIRTGFGSLDRIAGKGDVVLAHNLNGTLQLSTNNNVGETTFASAPVTVLDSLFWPRMVVGGPDGKTVHIIALTTPTSGDPAGLPFQGIDGALVYARSTNGGQTWDQAKVLLTGIDAANYKRFGGDGYAIDVRGNTVAFTAGDLSHDWFMMKSTDNGDTWTKTTILPFPIPNYDMETMLSDVDGDQVPDTIDNSDGSVAIVLDNNNNAHVFSGFGRMLNDALETPATYSFFPGQNGIMYWSEVAGGSPTIITGTPDIDGDGTLNVGGTFANYSTALASYPSAGVDANNNLYLIFGGAVETDANGSGNYLYDDGSVQVSYRHIFALKSLDNGTNWTNPQDLTDFDPLTEYMYASLARDVDDSIRLVYQEDPTPGCYINFENSTAPDYTHDQTDNLIKYIAYGTGQITSVKEQTTNFEGVNLYPNPATNATQLSFTLKKATSINASIINMLGQKVRTVNSGTMAAGNHNVQLNIGGLAPGVYFVNLQTGTEVITEKLIVR